MLITNLGLIVVIALLSSVRCQEGGDAMQCNVTQCCSCNFTEMEQEMLTYRETINDLSEKVVQLEAKDRLTKIKNTNNEMVNVSIDFEEIREIFNQEWRKKNNCPVGISDGRIPDSDITSSSVYNNDSDTYGAHLARLDIQPEGGNIGAWKSYGVPRIQSITCNQAFYGSSSSSARFSYSVFSRTNLVQMVRCPVNCGNHYSTSLYGTGVYTDFSSICRAAIHNGSITNAGGGIVTIRRVPRKTFRSSTHNAIGSSSYTASSGSFTFEPNHLLQWIQVDFQTPTLLTGVVTQGRPTIREEWVETFKLQYGNNQTDLATMKHSSNRTDITFYANRDRTSHVINMFLEPIRARFVRLVPYTWHGSISLRFEYLTC